MTSTRFREEPLGACAVRALLIVGVATVAFADVAAGQACVMEYDAAPLIDGEPVGLVRSLEASPDGRIYTTHPFEGVIRADGSRFWPTGGGQTSRGQLRPSTIGWLGDTLYVADESGEYALLFDGRGSVIGRRVLVAPAARTPFTRASLSGLLAGGRALYLATAPVEAVASGRASSFPLLAVEDGNPAVDTLAWLTRRHAVMRIDVDSVTTTFVVQPFPDDALFAVSADGERIVVAGREVDASSPAPTYSITAITASGDTIFRRSYPYEAIRMLDAWRTAAVDQVAGRLSAPPGMARGEWVSQIREATYLPAWLPPVSRIVLDKGGRVWVRREAVPGNDSIRWETLSPNGAREGSLELPSSLSVRAADGLVLWATEATEGRMHRLWRIEVRPC